MSEPMTRAQVAHHLKLALEGDPANLRHKVELLYKAVRPKRILHRTEYVFHDNNTITITLDRSRAKQVEELFFLWLDEHKVGGEWSIRSLKPRRVSTNKFQFTFIKAKEVIEVYDKPKSGKGKKVKKKATFLEKVDRMDADEASLLLERLLAKQKALLEV